MIVKIRFPVGPRRRVSGRKNRQLAAVGALVLQPFALLALLLAIWGLAAHLKLTVDFAFQTGLFSHWPVWVVLAAALQAGSILLGRYGRGDREAMP